MNYFRNSHGDRHRKKKRNKLECPYSASIATMKYDLKRLNFPAAFSVDFLSKLC